MKKEDLIKAIFHIAENYSGSGDTDGRGVMDGTEQSDAKVQDPMWNGGVNQDNKYYSATMPYSLDAHDSDKQLEKKDRPNPSRSDEYSDFPYSEQAVDSNHANNVTASFVTPDEDDSDNYGAGGGSNFMKHAPDSPQIMNDGHPLQDLQYQQQGVDYVVNNTFPHAPTEGDEALFQAHVTEQDKDKLSTYPDINKGRTASPSFNQSLGKYVKSEVHPIQPYENPHDIRDVLNVPDSKEQEPEEPSKLFQMLQPAPTKKHTPPAFERFEQDNFAKPSMFSQNNLSSNIRSAREIPAIPHMPKIPTIPQFGSRENDSGSNVQDIMYPDEVGVKHRQSTEDFGTKDTTGDSVTMSTMPNKGYSGTDEENENYSGFANAAEQILQNYLIKIATEKNPPCNKCHRTDYADIRCGLCDKCAFDKKADYGGVVPSVNPNSGADDDDELGTGGMTSTDVPKAMIDGKQVPGNEEDKLQNDVFRERKRRIYPNRVEDDEAEHYYGFGQGGGGFGNEGDGTNFSGVQPDS